MSESIKKYIYYFLLFLILVIGFILRLKGFISNPPMWHDETALGWNILNKTYLELFNKLRFLQVAPPLFLVFTKFLVFVFGGYKNAYTCDLILRIIPFIFGNLSLIIFYLTVKKIFNSKWTILAGTALIALNPILINYSFEFKPYSVDVFCVILSVYIFLKINFKTDNIKAICKYAFILAILPWFSFACAFSILAGFITLSFYKENPKMFIALLIPSCVSAILYLKFFVLNSYSDNSLGMLAFWSDKFVNKDLSNLTQLNNENLSYFFMNIPYLSVTLIGICVFAGAILLIKDTKYKYFLLSILTYSIAVMASIGRYYPFSRRLLIFLIPFLIIYLVKITDIKNWIIGWLLFVFILVPHFIFSSQFLTIKNLNKGDFARDMIFFMADNISSKDAVILNEASNTDYFYYNSFFKLPNKIEYIKPDTTKNETIKSVLSRLPKGTYWMFLSYDYNPQFSNIAEYFDWAKVNSKIIFESSATQSTLIKLIIN